MWNYWTNMLNEPLGCSARIPTVIHVDVVRSNWDYASVIFNAIIAIVAVSTVILPRIAERFFRKYELVIPDADRYVEREEEDAGGDTGKDGKKSKNIVYSLPVLNSGNVKLTRCEVVTDCVMKKGKDGVSFEDIYHGLPRRFKDETMGDTFDLAVGDRAHVRFVKFMPDQMEQSGMSGSENLKEDGGTPSVSSSVPALKDISEVSSHDDSGTLDQSYSWSLQAKCRNAQGDSLNLEVEKNVDYFVLVTCKAENLKVVYDRWIVVHWSGELVDSNNLTIRPASSDETERATKERDKLLKGA